MKMTMKAALLAATLTALTALPAQAQTANTVQTSVNARAGLAAVTSVECTDVNFGVWRVPERTTGGATFITLTVTGTGATVATPSGNLGNVALSTRYDAPTAGACSIIGAYNKEGTNTVAISNNLDMPMVASTHEGLPTPGALAAMLVDLTTVSSTAISGIGTGSFEVVGVLEIPEVIVAENYGGYVTAEPATVTVYDIIPANTQP